LPPAPAIDPAEEVLVTITVTSLVKHFGSFAALRGVDLTVRPGEFLALLGPSGSGKTTLLRILAGLEYPDAGHLTIDGADIAGQEARERQMGFVFQHFALFRHMTVAENVSFGLRVKPRRERPSRAEIRKRVEKLLRLVQLEQFGERYPSQLSGGQRQRVALARALAIEPKVLLLDEPFGALDAKVRKDLRRWLRGLHDEMGLTSIFVSHDQEEALELADRVAVMNEGGIAQIGTPTEIYRNPANAFVCEFLGNTNRLSCQIEKGGTKLGDQFFPAPVPADAPPLPGIAYVRPEDCEVRLDPAATGLKARVLKVHAAGPTVRVELRRLDRDEIVEALLPTGAAAPEIGSDVALAFRRVRVFPAKAA
jgi:sulfate transport system ATP-binding protein